MVEPWEVPARPLPVTFPPVHGEVLGWYLHRLAEANCTIPSRITQSVGPSGPVLLNTRTDALRKWTPAVLPRLATITGTSPETLLRSLPSIARLVTRHRGEAVNSRRDLYVACPHCILRRGITQPILAHLPVGRRLCHKHRIWLDGSTHYRLGQLPEVIDAQHRCHRLTSRFPQTIEKASIQATKLVGSWLLVKTQPILLKRWQRRLDAIPHRQGPDHNNLVNHKGKNRGLIAIYPEFVTMLSIIADPCWRKYRMPDSRLVTVEEHRHAMDMVFAEAEQRLGVPTLRDMPGKKSFHNDPSPAGSTPVVASGSLPDPLEHPATAFPRELGKYAKAPASAR
ncbi:TniQ family protein [Streptomyces sp. NBC_00441]|uniref:TniQ family protein n=1 Tax=Streptomyces sp. NBC_00441 TaxID=2975742 RepID=UPI002E2B4EE0|nr:TniQ family protein [Streptomyces sp. NBC_00441]